MSQVAFRNLTLILLTLTAGCVDAIGYLGLGQVFTANMTGNIVLLGMALGHDERMVATHSVAALIGFVIGAIAASEMVRKKHGDDFLPVHLRMALGLECFVLISFAVSQRLTHFSAHGMSLYGLIAMLGIAMGIQSNTAMRWGVKGITTTVMTSTLAELIEELADVLRKRNKTAADQRPKDTVVRGITLVAYGFGAVIGGMTVPHNVVFVCCIPIAILFSIILLSLFHFKA